MYLYRFFVRNCRFSLCSCLFGRDSFRWSSVFTFNWFSRLRQCTRVEPGDSNDRTCVYSSLAKLYTQLHYRLCIRTDPGTLSMAVRTHGGQRENVGMHVRRVRVCDCGLSFPSRPPHDFAQRLKTPLFFDSGSVPLSVRHTRISSQC